MNSSNGFNEPKHYRLLAHKINSGRFLLPCTEEFTQQTRLLNPNDVCYRPNLQKHAAQDTLKQTTHTQLAGVLALRVLEVRRAWEMEDVCAFGVRP